MAWPKGKPRKPAQAEILDTYRDTFRKLADPSENTGDEPMAKIQFAAVLLKRPITRLGGSRGLASSDTAAFSVEAGNTIELDTATNLVTISKGAESALVNREDCERFTPLKVASEPKSSM